MPVAGVPKEREDGLEAGLERVDLQAAPSKKDMTKKTEGGVFAPKKYFLVVRQFLAEAKVELRKVTWPARKELLSITAVVIILVILVAFFLGIIDLGLVKIIKNVIG